VPAKAARPWSRAGFQAYDHVRTWRKKTYEQLKKQFDIPLVGHGEATPPRYEPSLRE
jgi:hypothetical protein